MPSWIKKGRVSLTIIMLAHLVAGAWGQSSGYITLLNKYNDRYPIPLRPELSLKYNSDPATIDEDIAFLESLGLTVIWSGVKTTRPALFEAGFRNMESGSPNKDKAVTYFENDPALAVIPENEWYQLYYYPSARVRAGLGALTIEPLLYGWDSGTPLYRGGYLPVTRHDPKVYWRVYDRTAGTSLSGMDWNLLTDPVRVEIPSPVAGHVYQLLYLAERDGDIEPDVLYPEVAALLEEEVVRPELDAQPVHVYRPTSLGYFWDRLRMEKGLFYTRWVSQRGVQPEAQAQFTQDTGIAFDLDWWEDGLRFGMLNYPPPRERVAWMQWQMGAVEDFGKRLYRLSREKYAKIRLFWGDNWLGAEPYLGFFERTDVQQLTKPSKTAVEVRLVMDTPGPDDMGRYVRFGQWLKGYPEDPADQSRTVSNFNGMWAELKRVMLLKTPDGLTFGSDGMDLAEFYPGPVLEEIRYIYDEFEVMHRLLNRKQAYYHDFKVYFVTAWGKMRAWSSGYRDIHDYMFNPSNPVLEAVAHLPIEFGFLSIDELADSGVPEDADVLVNFGAPHSSWSGGFYWEAPEAAQAIRDFVAAGGGFIGIDAPSHNDPEGPTAASWALSDVLGLDFDAYTDRGAEKGFYNANDRSRLNLPRTEVASWAGAMQKSGQSHFLSDGLPETLGPIRAHVHPVATAGDVDILYSGDGASLTAPLLTVREAGGRVAYLSGYPTDPNAYRVGVPGIGVYFNDGSGVFPTSTTVATAGQLNFIQPTDLDMDGDLDMVYSTASNSNGTVGWVENQGNASLTWGEPEALVSFSIEADGDPLTSDTEVVNSLYAFDADADGDQDLVFTNSRGNQGIDRHIWFLENRMADVEPDNAIIAPANAPAKPTDVSGKAPLLKQAAVSFGPLQDLVSYNPRVPVLGSPADLNDDGFTDVPYSFTNNTQGARYLRNNGDGSWTADLRVIANALLNKVALCQAADIDQINGPDGVLIVGNSGDSHEGKVVWIPNQGAGTFGDAGDMVVIGQFAGAGNWVAPADMNGDGWMDVAAVSAETHECVWFENDGTPEEANWASHSVLVDSTVGWEFLTAADIDGDGDVDLFPGNSGTAGLGADLFWLENADGAGTAWNTHVIGGNRSPAGNLAANAVVDINDDGHMDLITRRDGSDCAVYFNNGSNQFASSVLIGSIWNLNYLYPGDMDLDGDVDLVFSTSTNGKGDVGWFENLDGTGNTWSAAHFVVSFSLPDSDTEAVAHVYAHDFDLDADLDIIFSNTRGNQGELRHVWYLENLLTDNTSPLVSVDKTKVALRPNRSRSVVVAQASDAETPVGDLTVSIRDVQPSDLSVSVENVNGELSLVFPAQSGIPLGAYTVEVRVSDGLRWTDFSVSVLYGFFAPLQMVQAWPPRVPMAGPPADLDNDGDLDVPYCFSNNSQGVRYRRNDGGSMVNWPEINVLPNNALNDVEIAVPGDMDGVNGMDMLAIVGRSGDADEGKVIWTPNNGSGGFDPSGVLIGQFAGPGSWVAPADMDGDTDMDVVAVSKDTNELVWFENNGSPETPNWTRHLIRDDITVDANFLSVGDVDGDGDVDVFPGCSGYGLGDDIFWLENTDGTGLAWQVRIIHENRGPKENRLVNALVDMDGDGDLDVVTRKLVDPAPGYDASFPNVNPQGVNDYRQLIRRLLFWAADAESQIDDVASDIPYVYTYLYPEEKLLVVYNADRSGDTANATVSCDVGLMGYQSDAVLSVTDILSTQVLHVTAGSDIASGIAIPVASHEIRFLRIEPAFHLAVGDTTPVLDPSVGSVPLNAGLRLNDAGGEGVSMATVSLVHAPDGAAETLDLTSGVSGMDVAYVGNVLTLTPTAPSATVTAAQMEAALEAVRYNNSLAEPDLSPRTLQWQAWGGTGSVTEVATSSLAFQSLIHHWDFEDTFADAETDDTGTIGGIDLGVVAEDWGIAPEKIASLSDANGFGRHNVMRFVPGGENQYQALSNLAPVSFALPTLTLSMWVYRSNGLQAGTPSGLFSQHDRLGFEISMDAGNQYRLVNDFEHPVFGESLLQAWQHLCVTWDGTSQMLYLNGERVASSDMPPSPDLSFNRIRLGVNRFDDTQLAGCLDDVGLYNHAVSHKEIAAIACLGRFHGLSQDAAAIEEFLQAFDADSVFEYEGVRWERTANGAPGAIGRMEGSMAYGKPTLGSRVTLTAGGEAMEVTFAPMQESGVAHPWELFK